MIAPFDVLGVSHEATPAEIRQAYLDLVRKNPPDSNPERFAEIQAAYQKLIHVADILEDFVTLENAVVTQEDVLKAIENRFHADTLPVRILISMAVSE